MKLTDEQRIKSIKKILQMQRHPVHKDTGDKADILISRTKNYPGTTEKSTDFERFFAISGKDTYESGQQWSCGTEAKTFCYLNSILPKNEQLEVKIMISTHPNHLIDSMANHTLPCVKMGDGKWYALEPTSVAENRIRHPMYPDIPFIMDELKVGNKIHHIKKGMVEKENPPYEITAIMSWQEYEEKCSDFGTFLKYGSKRDKKTKTIVATIETVLQQINSNGKTGNVYAFCTLMGNSKLPIKVIKPKGYDFTELLLAINGEQYVFMPNHKYLMIRKSQYEIEHEFTMDDYVKQFKGNVVASNKTYE